MSEAREVIIRRVYNGNTMLSEKCYPEMKGLLAGSLEEAYARFIVQQFNKTGNPSLKKNYKSIFNLAFFTHLGMCYGKASQAEIRSTFYKLTTDTGYQEKRVNHFFDEQNHGVIVDIYNLKISVIEKLEMVQLQKKKNKLNQTRHYQ